MAHNIRKTKGAANGNNQASSDDNSWDSKQGQAWSHAILKQLLQRFARASNGQVWVLAKPSPTALNGVGILWHMLGLPYDAIKSLLLSNQGLYGGITEGVNSAGEPSLNIGKSADKDTEELGTKILKQALRTYLT